MDGAKFGPHKTNFNNYIALKLDEGENIVSAGGA